MNDNTIEYLRNLVSTLPPKMIDLPDQEIMDELDEIQRLIGDKDAFIEEAKKLAKIEKNPIIHPIGEDLDKDTLTEVASFARDVILDGSQIDEFMVDPELAAKGLGITLTPKAVETLKKIPDPKLILPKLGDGPNETSGLVRAVLVIAVMAQLADKPLPDVIDKSIGKKP